MSLRGGLAGVLLLALAGGTQAWAQTPVSVSIHGPSIVYEANPADFRAVVLWDDGTRSSVSVAWSAAWNGSVPAFIGMTPFGSIGTLTTGDIAGNSTLTVSATFFGPLGPVSANRTVTVTDASSFPVILQPLVEGWNLVGNSIGAPLNVVATFGDAVQPVPGISDAVLSVWKWDAVNARWAFFTPTMTPAQLEAYAASKAYAVLQVVQPGEGYWINASQPLVLPARSGNPVVLATNSFVTGWNLVSTSQAMTPPELDTFIAAVPPAPGAVAQSYVSLWSWDADSGKWLFYAPSLAAAGGPEAVKAYADAHGYLDFATLDRRLGNGIGFWINSSTPNANSDLAPLGQAKAMFSELRTTVRSYTNDIKGGFLDAQSTRVSNELAGKVAPDLSWALQYADLLSRATRLYEDVGGGVASSYAVEPGTAGGTVRARQMAFVGSELFDCFSNDMAGAAVTAGLLTAVTCTWMDFSFDAYEYVFAARIKRTQRVVVTAGATVNDFNYGASKREIVETWNGTFFEQTSDVQVGATRAGGYSRTYLAGTRNLSSFTFSGDLPPRDPDADRDAVSLSGIRSVQDAGSSVYRYGISGSISSKDSGGADMVLLTLGNGSYFDAREDASGNPLPDSVRSVHVTGQAIAGNSRFTGTIDLNAFARDASGSEYVPTSGVFDGAFEDLSPGGAGTFLTGRLTVTLNNLGSYNRLQPESADNFLRFDTAFVGTIQATGRPEMRLTAGSSRTGVQAHSVNVNYAYGPVSVSGVGTLNTADLASSTLTLTNQDGITVTFHPHADAVVAKDGVTLGTIPYGSAIVYFIDGYFESL
jgi:hypothetical protein